MEQRPVKLRTGMKLMKRRGKTGPERTVVYVRKALGRGPAVRLQWTETRKGRGTKTMEVLEDLEPNGLPAGYVLAKDRKAVRK